MALKPDRTGPFVVDTESVDLLRDEVGAGVIHELRPLDAGMLARHLGSHPETVYIAASGVPVSGASNIFDPNQDGLLGVEWTRQENNPIKGEPELNTYRYLIGHGNDGKGYGQNVTEERSTSSNGQVGDHWMDLDTAVKRYPPDPKQ